MTGRVVLHEDEASTVHETLDVIIGRRHQLGKACRVESSIVDVELGLAKVRDTRPNADRATIEVNANFGLYLGKGCLQKIRPCAKL